QPPPAVGDSVLFRPADAAHGSELWKTNGTPEGTVLVKDVWPGPPSAEHYVDGTAVTVNGVAYFAANTGINDRELWRSDGTEGGTRRVGDLAPGDDGSWPREFVALDGTLYFIAYEAQRRGDRDALYRSDGTEAGTTK